MSLPTTKFVYGAVEVHKRHRLPHWETEGGVYFVTFRLADSLPKLEAERLEARLLEWRKQLTHLDDRSAAKAIARQRVRATERLLDRGYGTCDLRRPELADLVSGAFKFNNGQRYDLIGWCVMPNHAHVVFRLLGSTKLHETLKSWKSFTGHRAVKLLEVKHFWHEEYFDRLIRDSRHLDRTIRYVLNNPPKAGLRDWMWVGVDWAAAQRTVS